MRSKLTILLMLIIFSPNVSAAIDSEDGGGELWFSCNDVNDCSLTEFHTGEESISGTVNSATPFSPSTVFIELPMTPSQTEIALIPEEIEELQIDLSYQDDLVGISRPDLEVTVIIAQSTTVIDFQGDSNPADGIQGVYKVNNEPLDLGGDRLLWPNEEIRILLQFEVERPGTWQLNLRGASYMFLDIIWSEDVNSRDVDEPSSHSSPRQTELDTIHYGALVEDDWDCWSFDVDNHEIMTITIEWEEVPSEIEQNHGRPDLILPDNRLAPTPELETEVENGVTKSTWKWRALPIGEYDFCIGGKLNSFQPYKWVGLIAFESLGPTSPDGFDYSSWEWQGYGMKADQYGAEELSGISGIMVLVLSFAILIGLMIEFRSETTSRAVRFGIFVPGVLVLITGGIVSPMWAIAGEMPSSDEMTLDELIDNRLDQIWHASHPNAPASSRALHVGSTFGMLDGEELSIRLVADSAWPLDDGRWQLHIPEFYELDFESKIFAKVAEKSDSSPVDDLLDSHSRSFILLAARTLMLDILMLEALLVVDDLPNSNIIKFETEMVESRKLGSIQEPAWGTRPVDVPEGRWRLMQENLYPNLVSIILLDGIKDDLEFRVRIDTEIDHNLMYSSNSVQPSEPLLESQYIWIISGISLVLLGIGIESKRRKNAKHLLRQFAYENKWD
ncbi:MAG: hypothetical protein QF445_02740 [Candidatus Poseidoniaceae archaeon]|nr:hypothetical protein [Candidatus Poseidoniaceae archaeon]